MPEIDASDHHQPPPQARATASSPLLFKYGFPFPLHLSFAFSALWGHKNSGRGPLRILAMEKLDWRIIGTYSSSLDYL
ncbi:uncharacterized protein G2W53_001247 [Senna tora]|uniref:Uncharacterized protein n=1 Tax=Senna tora TaxID=362788 RepID=A0A834XHI0_9FABA|nr:uncharacterized protein G2W53_001247 [Senna tora]